MLAKKIYSQSTKKSFFYVWNEEKGEVRWMTSFNTTKIEVYDFAKSIKEVLRK